ncbi:hypothetical protein GCM10010341_31330 [Streptomyces noursei]|nr:hypothetical protein GCM10010341_31330 [Streptomyces noursei]
MQRLGAQCAGRLLHPIRWDRTSRVVRVVDQQFYLDAYAARRARLETDPTQVGLEFRFRYRRSYGHRFPLPSEAAAGLPPST